MNLALERGIHIQVRESECQSAPEMVAAFQNESTLFLVMTYAPYGTLWDRMCGLGGIEDGHGESSRVGEMRDSELRWWAAQMVSAIEWLHNQGFVHRWVVHVGSTDRLR